MAGSKTDRDMKALQRLITQADLVLATIANPPSFDRTITGASWGSYGIIKGFGEQAT